MEIRKTLIEVFSNPAAAIITALEEYDVPWKNNNYYVPDDMDYILNHSANKYVSRMVDILLLNDETLSSNSIGVLALTIFKMFSRKWDKLYNTYNLEYNPIENYNMTEIMTDDTTERTFGHVLTREDDLSHTKTGDETITHDTTDERTDDLTGDVTSDIQGFNSDEYVPSTKDISTNTGTQTLTKTGTDTTNHDITESDSGTQTNTESGTNTDVRNYELNRTGNIGVTTSQQMIEQERKLWEFNFVQIVYNDIDSVLTIGYYGR